MQKDAIKIEKVVYGGKGLSRDLQKVTFIPFVLAGEKARVQVTRERRDYLEADPIEIIEPSPDRVVPDCPYFGRCGGCQISHASYDAQLRMKQEMLRETLQRSKIPIPNIDVFPSPPFGYRHRIRLKYNAKEPALGFFEADSNRIVDIKECLCATPGLNKLLTTLRNTLLGRSLPRLTEIECFENERGDTAAYCNAPLPEALRKELNQKALVYDSEDRNAAALTFRFRDFEFPMSPDVFLQVNPFLMNAMVQEVESHHPVSREAAVELYCGSGFFTLPLAPRFGQITACEESSVALDFAKSKYERDNIRWIHDQAEHLTFPQDATALILDPPRAGLTNTIVEKILRHSFSRISYVSCDAPSFARDVKRLSPRYSLARLSLLDVFPQTTHFETIGLLTPL